MGKTIVFCAGAPDPYVDILEELPYDCLVGVDGGAHVLMNAGYTLDYAFGDFDSSAVPTTIPQLTVLPCEKDDTDLEYALQHMLAGYRVDEIQKIIIIGALGGSSRLDHLLCNIWLYHQKRFEKWIEKIIFLERFNTVSAVKNGRHQCYQQADKQYLSFIGLTPIKQLHIQGAKYGVSGVDYPRPMALISNEFLHKEVSFSFEEGILLVLQSSDRH